MRNMRIWVTCVSISMMLVGCIDEQPDSVDECHHQMLDDTEYCVPEGTWPIHETGFRCVDGHGRAEPVCPADLPVCNDSARGPFCAREHLPADQADRIGEAIDEAGREVPDPDPQVMDGRLVDDDMGRQDAEAADVGDEDEHDGREPMPQDAGRADRDAGDAPDGDPPIGRDGERQCPGLVDVMVSPALDEMHPFSTISIELGPPDDPRSWSWFLETPLHSRATLTVDESGVRFIPDLVGIYTVDGTVGAPWCDTITHTFTFMVEPPPGLYAELAWFTPGPDELPEGPEGDLDVILRHEQAGDTWAPGPMVCDFRNAGPDWGPVGDAGDPNLLFDGRNGLEVIHVPVPEPGVRYGLALHAFDLPADLPGDGEQPAVLQVWADGVPGFGLGVLLDPDDLLWMLDVVWCDVADADCERFPDPDVIRRQVGRGD